MNIVHMVIMLALMFGVRFLPEFGEITAVGMQILGVFLGVLYGWIFIGLLWPSVVGFIAIGLTEVCTVSEYVKSGFGNPNVFLIFCILFIIAGLIQLELSDVIVNALMSLKIAKGRPWVKVFLFLLAAFIIALLTQGIVVAVMFVPLCKAFAARGKIQPGAKMNSVLFTGLCLVAGISSVALPYKTSFLAPMNVLSASVGINYNFGKLLFAMPMFIVMFIFYILICKYILRVDVGSLREEIGTFGDASKTITKRQTTYLVFVGIMLLLLLLPDMLPDGLWLSNILSRIGSGGSVMLLIAIMLVLRVDGEPLMDLKKLSKDFSWDMYFMIAFFMPLISYVTSADAGITATLSAVVKPVVSGMSSYGFVCLIVLLTIVATNFLNNAVVGMLFVTILSLIANNFSNENLYAIAVIILIASCTACVTPAASPMNAFLFGQTDVLDIKYHIKHSLVSSVLLYVFLVTVFYGYLVLVL